MTLFINFIKTQFLLLVLYILSVADNKKLSFSNDDIKFTDVARTRFKSDFGPSECILRTIKYETYFLKTIKSHLFCADNHLVLTKNNTYCMVKDLVPGDELVYYSNGIFSTDIVEYVESTNTYQNMYSLHGYSDDVTSIYNNAYTTNGIVSSNTATSSAYILWKATFTDNCTILICANTLETVMEIIERIKAAYEELPDFIRCGVVEYNKKRIAFDNGSRIIGRATTKNSGRGLSITLLYCAAGTETVTVRDVVTNEEKIISLKELYNELGDYLEDDSFGF